jgi:hypothetical protein
MTETPPSLAGTPGVAAGHKRKRTRVLSETNVRWMRDLMRRCINGPGKPPRIRPVSCQIGHAGV